MICSLKLFHSTLLIKVMIAVALMYSLYFVVECQNDNDIFVRSLDDPGLYSKSSEMV